MLLGQIDPQGSKISLEEVIEYSIEHSLAAQKADIEKAQGIQDVAEGVGMLLPNLSAGSSTGAASLDTLGEGSWNSQFSLSQPVIDATTIFGVVGKIHQSGISRAQARQTFANLILDVEKAYYNLAKSQALVESAEGQYSRAKENLRIVERRYELGAVAKADRLRAEASLLAAETELVSAKTDLEANQRVLSDLMGLERWSPLNADELPDAELPDSLSTTVIGSAMLEENPDFDLLRRQVKASEITFWGSWATLLPSLSFSAGKSFTQDGILPSFSQWDDTPTSYGLSLSFPIANLKDRALDINRARLDRKAARIDFAQQKLEFNQSLANLLASQSSSYKNWQVASKNLELSQEVVRLSTRSYELGSTSLVDLLQAEADLVDAEKALVEAKALYWSSRADLNYFLGTSLEDK